MKQERLQILKMLDEGKINPDEAVRLLEAVRVTAKEYTCFECDGITFDEKVKEFSQNAESFAKDLGEKMSSFYKGVEPKIRKATKVVVEKTVNVVDEISKSLNETIKNLEKEECECNEAQEPCCCADANAGQEAKCDCNTPPETNEADDGNPKEN